MTKMDKKELILKFGYDEGYKKMFLDLHTDIGKGNFIIRQRSGKWYWYYNLSARLKNRTKYLCGCYEGMNPDGINSFQKSLHILLKKHNTDYKSTLRNSYKVSELIDEWIGLILKEEQSPEGRKLETTQSMRNGINKYKDFVLMNDTRLSDLRIQSTIKQHIKDYIEHCKNRDLKRNTIRTYVKFVRQFLSWLSDEEVEGGRGILENNPINVEFCSKIYPPSRKESTGIGSRNVYFKDEWWSKMYNDCLHKVGDLWDDFCKNGWSRGNTNQPVGVGSDVVYFISLFQLHSGFRMGEVLTSHRSREDWLNRRDKKNSSCYWENVNGNWFLYIEDFKGKDGTIPVNLEIRSTVKPPTDACKKGQYKQSKEFYWDTQLVDVCLEMFRHSPYLFSSPNYMTHADRHYGKTYYMNIFKMRMVTKGEGSEGWESYGVMTSHNLRSYFITYQINQGVQLEDLTQITRHNPQTLWKYYLRQSEQGQLKRQTQMDKSRKITKRKSHAKVKDK